MGFMRTLYDEMEIVQDMHRKSREGWKKLGISKAGFYQKLKIYKSLCDEGNLSLPLTREEIDCRSLAFLMTMSDLWTRYHRYRLPHPREALKLVDPTTRAQEQVKELVELWNKWIAIAIERSCS